MSNNKEQGKEKALLRFFFPFFLITFSNFSFLLVEKLFLARVSSEAMQAAVNVAYVCQIFQGACVALVMMAQVFVGRWVGAKEEKMIGPAIWQFLWFSLFSLIITIPGTLLYGHFYFQGTEVEKIALPYFYFLMGMNFFYPLAATLTCFYSGRGKMRLILFSTLAMQVLKVVLGYFLIFGWGPIAPLGILGGAFSTLIAQGGFCAFLFFIFLNSKHRELYKTNQWHFQTRLFIECVYPGFLRALNRLLNFACWASIAHLMIIRGGQYILILSLGGTLFLFLPFLADALSQAQTTVVSHLIGAQRIEQLKRAIRSGYFLVLMLSGLLAVPFLFFPQETFHLLFPDQVLDHESIRLLFLGVFASFIWFLTSCIPISTVLAFKDMKFSFIMGLFGWINGFLFIYYFIEKIHISANQFWLTLSFMHASNALIYHLRSRYLVHKLFTSVNIGPLA